MRIETDFVDDIIAGLTAELTQLGYTVPPATGTKLEIVHRVGVQHWNAYARRIPATPRTVHRSPELVRNASPYPVVT